ncbi:MAG: MFS transporter [Planctomycetes bacterium]|nr:MFS transporter [Planctomycetota bacterium]
MTAPATAASPGDTGPASPLPGARSALILLLAINLFNYIDRQVLAAVLPKIEQTFVPDDPLAKTKMGWLTTAFLVSYMLLAPVFGWLGDRMSRWLLVSTGVILWSIASGASGLAETYFLLLATRCFVGVGEAAYGPTAPTLISDMYPIMMRGRVLAWFYMAIPVGGALGYVLGGAMADTALGWRWAFYLVVPPGILLGLLCMAHREPARGQAEKSLQHGRQIGWRDYLVLARIPSYRLNTLGMTAMTFAVGGIAVWMPTYIYEREARFQWTVEVRDELVRPASSSLPAGLPGAIAAKLTPLLDHEFRKEAEFAGAARALLSNDDWQTHEKSIVHAVRTPKLGPINTIFGAIVVVSGLIATLGGGLAGDWLRPRIPGSYFLVSGVTMALAFPMLLLVLIAPFPWAWLFVFGAVFCLFFNTGPTNTILANVTHPAIRSSAFAINILIIHALGDAISPPVMGMIADHWSMEAAFAAVSVIVLVGAGFWLAGTRHLQRDTELAGSRLS